MLKRLCLISIYNFLEKLMSTYSGIFYMYLSSGNSSTLLWNVYYVRCIKENALNSLCPTVDIQTYLMNAMGYTFVVTHGSRKSFKFAVETKEIQNWKRSILLCPWILTLFSVTRYTLLFVMLMFLVIFN